MRINIGKNIKFFRKEAHLTQIEFAEKLGLKQYAIAKYEANNYFPPPKVLIKMAKILKVGINELFGFKKSITSEEKPPKNSRIIQMQEVFKELKAPDQRAILKQAKAILNT